MAQIHYALRRVTWKLVLEGPPFSGKTTNLERIRADFPASEKGAIFSPSPEVDRTLYLDVTPLERCPVEGMTMRFQFATAPGRNLFQAPRRAALKGVDGIVFVADSSPDAMPRNLAALSDLERNLEEVDLDLDAIPLVFQWNKRDVPDALPLAELEALDRRGAPRVEAVAREGQGVVESIDALTRLIFAGLPHRDRTRDATG